MDWNQKVEDIMLDKLRVICDELLKNTNEEKYSYIKRLLEDDDVFKKINADEAVSILSDLGFNKYEITNIYPKLLDKKN
jgi:hypothetical protein